MTLKDCTCCGKKLTSKDVRNDGQTEWRGHSITWFTCLSCKSTMIKKEKITDEKTNTIDDSNDVMLNADDRANKIG